MPSPDNRNTPDELNSPDLKKSLKKPTRAITSPEQLAAIIKKLEEDNRTRNQRNARIMSKYNAEKPYRDSELEEHGVGWRSNFSTQPLSTLIDRISPRFARALEAPRYLTSAKLPDHISGAEVKTETFRREFTKLVRGHPKWKALIGEVSMEDPLFGYTATGYTDDTEWYPEHFRQDAFFVYSGTSQSSSDCPLLVFKEPLLPHELFALISEGKDTAEDAGWDFDEVLETINKALPEDITKNIGGDERKFEDLYRESNLGNSLMPGAKTCLLYHGFVTEVTGKVSHYILNGRTWKQIFAREDQFDGMEEVVNFWTFQQANGKLQGSKGVGRTVYALAGIIDRARNEVVDRFQISGKIILQGETADLPKFRMSVVGGAVLISKNFTLSQNRIESGVEHFITLDNWVLRIMDELAGNLSPAQVADQIQGERPTNGQINMIADLNNEGKDAKIERFLMNAAGMITQMQIRASKSSVDDQRARDFRASCLRVMSEEELKLISEQPSNSTVDGYTERERQIIIMTCDALKGDPLVDQKKILRQKLTATIDADFADSVMLADEDPNVTAEQQTQQLLENMLLDQGQLPQVSLRHHHGLHLQVLLQGAEKVAGEIAQDPNKATVLKGYLVHGQQHLAAAAASGIDEETLQPFAQQLAGIENGLAQMADAMRQQAGQTPQGV